MERRRYGRGTLTPVDGHHPTVLGLWVRLAERNLDPLTRQTAEQLWHRLRCGRPLKALWDAWLDLTRARTKRARARIFAAAAGGCELEALNKTLQRARRRGGH